MLRLDIGLISAKKRRSNYLGYKGSDKHQSVLLQYLCPVPISGCGSHCNIAGVTLIMWLSNKGRCHLSCADMGLILSNIQSWNIWIVSEVKMTLLHALFCICFDIFVTLLFIYLLRKSTEEFILPPADLQREPDQEEQPDSNMPPKFKRHLNDDEVTGSIRSERVREQVDGIINSSGLLVLSHLGLWKDHRSLAGGRAFSGRL